MRRRQNNPGGRDRERRDISPVGATGEAGSLGVAAQSTSAGEIMLIVTPVPFSLYARLSRLWKPNDRRESQTLHAATRGAAR
jgi:hypothetical protein